MGGRTRNRATVATVLMIAIAGCGSGNGAASAETVASGGTLTPATQEPRRRPAPGTAWVIFGADTVVAEVASTPDARAKGLMDRDAIPAGTGMLFVFPDNEYRSFWMKDTYVSLDVAFLDERYAVTGIKQMEALDETLVDSDTPAALALEVVQGWLAEHGIGVGATARIVFGPGLRVR